MKLSDSLILVFDNQVVKMNEVKNYMAVVFSEKMKYLGVATLKGVYSRSGDYAVTLFGYIANHFANENIKGENYQTSEFSFILNPKYKIGDFNFKIHKLGSLNINYKNNKYPKNSSFFMNVLVLGRDRIVKFMTELAEQINDDIFNGESMFNFLNNAILSSKKSQPLTQNDEKCDYGYCLSLDQSSKKQTSDQKNLDSQKSKTKSDIKSNGIDPLPAFMAKAFLSSLLNSGQKSEFNQTTVPESKSESNQTTNSESNPESNPESKCKCELCTKKISLFDLFFGKKLDKKDDKSQSVVSDEKTSVVSDKTTPDLVTETTQLRPNLIDETTTDKCITSDVINESPVVSDD